MRGRMVVSPVFLALCVFCTASPALYAQGPVSTRGNFYSRAHLAVGYAVNAPTQLMGFSGLLFGAGIERWGVYADAKFTLESPADEPDFDPSLTVGQATEFGDVKLEDRSEWTTFNLALVRVITGDLALYAGGGFSREVFYRRYFDSTRTRGFFGNYWVEDGAESGDRINFLVGGWFRAHPRFLFQFGLESAPRGFTVGAGYVLPLFR